MKERVRAPAEIQRLEMRGVPVRVELGPKDVAKQAPSSRAATAGQGRKDQRIARGPAATIERLLAEIQQSLHDKALAFRKSNTRCKDLRRPEEGRRGWLCLLLLVRECRLRSQNQGRNPRHHAMHSPGAGGGAGLVFTAASPPPRGRSSLGLLGPFLSANMSAPISRHSSRGC